MYRRTDSVNRGRSHWHEERRSATVVRKAQARQPQKRQPTQAEQDALEKYAKALGAPALTAIEYAELVNHPMISEEARARIRGEAREATNNLSISPEKDERINSTAITPAPVNPANGWLQMSIETGQSLYDAGRQDYVDGIFAPPQQDADLAQYKAGWDAADSDTLPA